ncbi:MAG: glutathione S-transferase family protein [Rhodospirillaceae bacterium]|jgi:glutathione S-transferase|nr:glutathione S-transferase family protein [Rhodospirillaceae bacterium]MBT7954840.1 glutathione S-transferase family protein [Rhodospirillaceae bacterium]
MRKLYGRKTSINVQKASWILAELNLEFEWVFKEDKPGGLETTEYAALNPQLRVPTLDDNGTIVRQSNTIVRYLANKYSHGNLWPSDPGEAAAADYWMDWQASDNWRNVVAVFWNLFRVPPEERNDEEVAKGVIALGKDFEFLNGHLADQEYVAGNSLTMGDIPVGAAVHRFYALPIERPQLPHVEAYYARLQERPAFCENVMVPMP